ncbi:hypothetical protein [Nonomuraea typhae]|uniref:hypothetical protein n=1 Tax=Nonomuraea typhae TaxID=2603600 RepID=UPI0012F8A392|nr:hypothetical protein [Nonomuraea typhae]
MPEIPEKAIREGVAAYEYSRLSGVPVHEAHAYVYEILRGALPYLDGRTPSEGEIREDERRKTAESIARAIEVRGCEHNPPFHRPCACRQGDAALARKIGDAALPDAGLVVVSAEDLRLILSRVFVPQSEPRRAATVREAKARLRAVLPERSTDG